MSQFDLHSPLFHWQGRHDAEDGKLPMTYGFSVKAEKDDEAEVRPPLVKKPSGLTISKEEGNVTYGFYGQ